MPLKNIQYILFDAANTLIHKPSLWPSMQSVLQKHGYNVPDNTLKQNHKLLSEVVNFPDRTSKDFYSFFNAELLLSLGILPSGSILDDMFAACSYLPWERFEDTDWIKASKLPIGVLSNFNNNLPGILNKLFDNDFANIIVSESVEMRKPDKSFYQHAIDSIGLPAANILYIGDSLKLDIIPAEHLGFNSFLIDRNKLYLQYNNRLSSLMDLDSVIS